MLPPSVELRSTHIFLVLARELHFSRTAEEVGVSPSRVSQVVRDLERHVGGRLFERSSRQVRLTSLGRRLCDDLSTAYAQFEDALVLARGEASGVAGVVKVGAYALFNYGPRFFEVVDRFEAVHPLATVQPVELTMHRDPLCALRERRVDALATRLPVSDDDVVVGPLLSHEERVLLVARHHPLAARESVSVEDLGDYVVNDPPGLPRELIEAFVPRRTPAGREIVRTAAAETLFDAVAAIASGRIVHATVPSAVPLMSTPEIVAVPIEGLPASETALVRLAADDRPAVAALAACLARHPPDPEV